MRHGEEEGVIDRLAVPLPGRHYVGHSVRELAEVVERNVPQSHERRHRFDVDGEGDGIPQRSVGVGEGAIQVGVRAGWSGGDDLARAHEDVHGADRLVGQAVPEAARLDPQPGDRPTEGNRAQLRDHQRHHATCQRRVDNGLVGRHSLNGRGASRWVDVDNAGQTRDVQTWSQGGGAGPEEVGRPLGQPDRHARVQARETLGHRLHSGLVLSPGHHRTLTSSRRCRRGGSLRG